MANKRSIMTLFSDPQDLHSHRVRLVLAEKHVVTEIVDVDPLNPPEDMLDLNPYGSAPTLVDRDLALFDSRIILEYLDERFPHPPLLPVDPVSRASFRLYMYRVEHDWYTLADKILEGGRPATKYRKELKESLIAHTLELFPFLANLRLMRQWAGITDMTPDYSPIMGESPVKNYWLDAGGGTWGFKANPVSGKRMAETIAREQAPEILRPFRLDRFETFDLANEMGATAASH